MTQEILEIEAGNKLIAEFMGYQILHKKYQTQYQCSSNETDWMITEGNIVCDSNGREVDDERQEPYELLEDLPFNRSWDWLMPVYHKITNLIEEEINEGLIIRFNILYSSVGDGDPIIEVWRNIVKFIILKNKTL